MLVSGPALDQQHAPGPAWGRHEHAADVVPRHQLVVVDGNLDRVEGCALRLGRHRDDGPGDGAVRRRIHRHHPQHAAVLQHPDLERLRGEPVADGGEREVDGRPRDHRTARAQVDHLAVAGGLGSAGAHREDGRSGRRGGGSGPGIGAVGHQHDAGQPALPVVRFDQTEGAGQIAPAGLGPRRRELQGLEPFADPPQLDLHRAGEGRNQVVADRGHRRIETARAAGVGDTHAARLIEKDRKHRARRGRRLHPHRPGEQEDDQQEDGESDSDQQPPAPPRQRRERPQIAPAGGGGAGRDQPQRHPPRPPGSEAHHGTARRAPASDR